MQKTMFTLLAVAAALPVAAQTTDGGNSAPAPIVRSDGRPQIRQNSSQYNVQINTTQPINGVSVRFDAGSSVRTLSSGADGTEIRVEHGRATVEVHHPAANSMITVDLPGGQTDLVKDGVYTFNAETNTVRVLVGEADAYAGMDPANAKPVKIKEEHELSFAAGNLKAVDADPRQMAADLVPSQGAPRGYNGGGYGRGPYGDGYAQYPGAIYPYPYYGYGYGYPYFGYPYGLGLGFGYYGGYYGGFRGGYYGGRFGRR